MRFLKLIFVSIALLFVLASIIGMLLSSRVLVSRAVNVEQYRDSIMPYLKDINQWRAWMEGMEDTAVTVYSATEAKLGSSHVQVRSVTDTTVVTEWTPRSGTAQTATMYLIGNNARKITVVQWQFEQKLKWYPWERLGSMMNDKILGTMMEKNLNRLKQLAEQSR